MLAIRRLLTDEKYLGNYVYNRKSGKLKSRRKANPPDSWIRCNNAFEAIIDPTTFAKAAKRIEARSRRAIRTWKSDREMLSRLKACLQREGRLSAGTIDGCHELPRHMTYIYRFGSLRHAYELIGYRPDTFRSSDARRAVVATAHKVAADLVCAIQSAGIDATFDAEQAKLTIAPQLSVSIIIVRCQRMATGALRWPVRRRIDSISKLVLVVRLQQDNASVLDYFLMPQKRVPKGRLTFRRTRRAQLQRFRMTELGALVGTLLHHVDSNRPQRRWRVAPPHNPQPKRVAPVASCR